LIAFFFHIRDLTTVNRQGNDRGASYRSAIFYTDDAQKAVADETIADVEASGLWSGKVVTELSLAGDFGKPSRSIRIIASAGSTDTRITSSGRSGRCRGVRLPLGATLSPPEGKLNRGSLDAAGGIGKNIRNDPMTNQKIAPASDATNAIS
jgi:hypothetical protein